MVVQATGTVNIPFIGVLTGGSSQSTVGKGDRSFLGRIYDGIKSKFQGSKLASPKVTVEKGKDGENLLLRRSQHVGTVDLERLRKAHPVPPRTGGVTTALSSGVTTSPDVGTAKTSALGKTTTTASDKTDATSPEPTPREARRQQLDKLWEGVGEVRGLHGRIATAPNARTAEALGFQLRDKAGEVGRDLEKALNEARKAEAELRVAVQSDPSKGAELADVQLMRRELIALMILAELPNMFDASDSLDGLKAPKGEKLESTRAHLEHAVSAMRDLDDQGLLTASLVRKMADFQHVRDWSDSPVAQKRNDAAGSLAVMAEGLRDGTLIDLLLAGDSRMDAQALKLKLHAGGVDGDVASDPAKQKKKAAIELRHELGKAERKLARGLELERRVWYKLGFRGDPQRVFSGSGLGGVKVDARLLAALHAKGGSDGGRDVAFLLANVALMRRQLDQLEGTPGSKAEVELQKLQTMRKDNGWSSQALSDAQTDESWAEDELGQAIEDFGEDSDQARQAQQELDLVRTKASLGQKIARLEEQVRQEKADASAKRESLGPLADLGIDKRDLETMGLGKKDIAELERLTGEFIRQGLSSSQDVRQVTDALNKVIDRVLTHSLTGGNIEDQSRFAPEARARMLTDAVFRDMSGKLDTYTLGPGSDEIAEGFKAQLGDIADGVGDVVDALALSTGDLERIEADIAQRAHGFHDIDQDVQTARKTLEDLQKAGKIKVDPQSPKGLQSATVLIRALETQQKLQEPSLGKMRRKALELSLAKDLQALKGFDLKRMHTPWWRGQDFTKADLAKVDADTIKAARAIVTIREAPGKKEALKNEIVSLTRRGDDLLAQRREHLSDNLPMVKNAIRAAVLATRPSDVPLAKYEPSAHRAQIETTLQSWGVDPKLFGPEISDAIYTRLDPPVIESWLADTRISPVTAQKLQEEALEMLEGSRDAPGVDRHTMSAFVATIDTMQKGEKLRLATGDKVTLSTGKIPIEPHDMVKVQARVAMGDLASLELAYGGDGYQLFVKAGFQGALGADVIADFKVAEATLSAEGYGHRVTGAMLRFPPTQAGKEQLVAFLQKMGSGEKLTASDWTSAEKVFPVIERKVTGTVGASAQTTVDRLGNIGGLESLQQGVIGDKAIGTITAGASAGISVAGTYLWQDQSNSEVTVHSTVKELSVTVSAQVGIYGKLFSLMSVATDEATNASGLQGQVDQAFGMNAKGQSRYDLATQQSSGMVLSAGIGITETIQSKTKEVRDADGLLGPGCERAKTSSVNLSALGAIAMAGNDELVSLLDKDPKLVEGLTEMVSLAKANDFVTVTYGLDEDVRARINDLRSQAIELREAVRGGGTRAEREERASALEKEASRLYDADSSWHPSGVSLNPAQINKVTVSNIASPLLKWETISEGRLDKVALALKLTPTGTTGGSTTVPPVILPRQGGVDGSGGSRPTTTVAHKTAWPPETQGRLRMGDLPSRVDQGDAVKLGEMARRLPAPRFGDVVSPGPVEHGRDFYLEAQTNASCARHAINAFLGGPLATDATMTALNMATVAERLASGQTVDRLDMDATRGNYPNQLRDYFDMLHDEEVIDFSVDLHEVDLTKSNPTMAHGLPAITADRAIIGSRTPSEHYVAFRKDTAGDWWLLDSVGEKRSKMTPEAYVATLPQTQQIALLVPKA